MCNLALFCLLQSLTKKNLQRVDRQHVDRGQHNTNNNANNNVCYQVDLLGRNQFWQTLSLIILFFLNAPVKLNLKIILVSQRHRLQHLRLKQQCLQRLSGIRGLKYFGNSFKWFFIACCVFGWQVIFIVSALQQPVQPPRPVRRRPPRLCQAARVQPGKRKYNFNVLVYSTSLNSNCKSF